MYAIQGNDCLTKMFRCKPEGFYRILSLDRSKECWFTVAPPLRSVPLDLVFYPRSGTAGIWRVVVQHILTLKTKKAIKPQICKTI